MNESLEKLPNLTEIEFISDEKILDIFFNLLNSSHEFINNLLETFKNIHLAIEGNINLWLILLLLTIGNPELCGKVYANEICVGFQCCSLQVQRKI